MEIAHTTIPPTRVAPAPDNCSAAHHSVLLAIDPSIEARDGLFVFLPGTDNQPDDFDEIGEIAARASYPVIVLAWDSQVVPAGYCAEATIYEEFEACSAAVMEEKAYGIDATDAADIDEPSSITGRLVRLLGYIDGVYPDAGADRHLDGRAPRWSSIVLGGFSQGSMVAGYISRDHETARTVLLAGACDATELEGELLLAGWCSDPRATPADRTWALVHPGEELEAKLLFYEAFGLLDLGEPVDVEAASPACCSDSHVLTFNLEVEGREHLSTAHDQYLPMDGEVPVLAHDSFCMFMAEQRRSTLGEGQGRHRRGAHRGCTRARPGGRDTPIRPPARPGPSNS